MQLRGAIVIVASWVSLLIVGGAFAADGPAFLVKDVNVVPPTRDGYEDEPSSYPSRFTTLNGVVYFAAGDIADSYGEGPNGVELWRSDGTRQGTRLVLDLRPGPDSSVPVGLQVRDGALYFLALDDDRGLGLWRSDGTAAGTQLIGATGFDADVRQLVRFGADWLTLLSSPYGVALWSVGVDGTFSEIATLTPEPSYGLPYDSGIVVGERFAYFTGPHPTDGQVIWRTDGTAAGTQSIYVDPGDGSAVPQLLGVVGDTAFLNVRTEQYGHELWRADASGASLLREFFPGPESGWPTGLAVLDGAAIFAALDPDYLWALWRSDGTAAGTHRLASLGPNLRARPFTRFGDHLYFGTADDIASQLWRTDGTAEGTSLVRDFVDPRAGYDGAPAVVAAGDRLMMLMETSDGVELWRSDGSARGTALLHTFDWITYTQLDGWSGATTADGTFIFPGDHGTGVEPWRSDGTPEGTEQLVEINPGATDFTDAHGAGPRLTDAAGTLAFIASDGLGYQDPTIWMSDGSEAGTFQVDAPTPDYSMQLIAAGPACFFAAEGTGIGTELWSIPAPGDAAVPVGDIYRGPNGSYPLLLGTFAGEVIMAADDGVHGTELWSPYGEGLIANLSPDPGGPNGGAYSSSPRQPVVLRDGLYFLADLALWRTDGTAPGTVRLADLEAGYDARVLGGGDRLALIAFGDAAVALWYSDGTADGTRKLADLPLTRPTDAPLSIEPVQLLAFVGRTLLFTAFDPDHGAELWASDGSVTGTGLLADLNPGPGSSLPNSVGARDGAALFFATDGLHGREPWISDGTQAGTRMVADIWDGPHGSRDRRDRPPAVVGDVFVFAASDGAHGYELWRSDGTAAGTVMLHDIVDGPRSSSPAHFAQSGQLLYFTANDNQHGRELWAAPLDQVGCSASCPNPSTPSPTPPRTPRPVWTPGPPLPTYTATPPPTRSSTPQCHLDASHPDCVVLDVGSAAGAPGERVEIDVVLRTNNIPVAGIQLDLRLVPENGAVRVVDLPTGRPDCRVNPTIGKNASGFSHPLFGDPVIRALIISVTDVDPIPGDSLLYSCTYEIAADAAPGSVALQCERAGAATPEGYRIPLPDEAPEWQDQGGLLCRGGSITVFGPDGPPSPAPTATPNRGGALDSASDSGGCQAAGAPAGSAALLFAPVLALLAVRRRRKATFRW